MRFASVTLYAAIIIGAMALDNGVGKLPALGYNTWNYFQGDFNSSALLAQAEAMVKHGLLAAGYNTFMLDDTWSLRDRSSAGKLVADPTKFPDGIEGFTEKLKLLGFNAGIYGDSGYETCAGYPGSYGHEDTDVETWAEWGFTYLKYDNCFIPFDKVTQQNILGRYERMSDAIARYSATTHRTPLELALCEWGWQQPWIWAARIGQSWRVDGDIQPWWSSLARILSSAAFISPMSNFYGRNDYDMLEVGNTGIGSPPGNLTFDEAKSHFTAWALLKSPLIIGTDLTRASHDTITILCNQDILKINQDPNVGQAITPFRWGHHADWTNDPTTPAEYWSGNSSYGVVFMVLNSQDSPKQMFFNLTESWAIRAGRLYSVYDLWSHTHNGTAMRNMTFTLPPHGVTALLLNDAGPEPPIQEAFCAGYWQCTYPNGTYYSN